MAKASPLLEMAALSLGNCVQAVIDCDLCEGTTDVHWRCDTCSANICATCKTVHESRKAFRQHKIIIRRTKSYHLKDVHIECNRMAEIHHNGSKTMLEYKKDSNWFISTIDEDGNVENPKKFNFTAHGFTLSSVGTIYVCDIDDNLIWSVLPDGSMKEIVNTTPEQPWGVCLNHEGNIVVCLKSSIVVFSKDKGNRLKTIRNVDERGNKIFSWAYKIFQDQRRQYRLLDWEGENKVDGRCVFGFDTEFNLKWSYTSEQRESAYSPLSICGDPFQNVLVAFYSGTVELLDSRGNFLMLMKTNNYGCPQQVSVAKNNVLWVVNELSRNISLLQYI